MDWLDRYKVIRRFTLFWVIVLISFATYMVYSQLELITAAVVTLYGTTTGLLGVVLGYYFKRRFEEDNSDK